MYYYKVELEAYLEESWSEILISNKKYSEKEFAKLCREIESKTYLPEGTRYYEAQNKFLSMIIDELCNNNGFERLKLQAEFGWNENKAIKE